MSNDLYSQVTASIVSALERGAAPWVRPWSTLTDVVPMNAGSRRPYRGVNVLLLDLTSQAQGYPLNRWLTYRQALEMGAQVKRGEHGTTIVFWQLRNVAATADVFPDGDHPDLPDKVYPLLRAYTVFNVAQVDGLPADCLVTTKQAWEPEAKAEELLLMSGATFRHGGSKAFYQPNTDDIHLPPRPAFLSAGGYYNVALHELTHWTSHGSRCNRQLGQRYGDDAYAVEELIAELGAAFLLAHCRIDGELRHAGYLASWLKVLRTDKRAIFAVAAKAQRAADYVGALANPHHTTAIAA